MTPEEWANTVNICLRRLEPNEMPPHSVVDHPAQYQAIVDAIRAAVAAEREACAAILDAAADRQKAAWDKLIAAGDQGPFTSYEAIFRGFADDIRARGQDGTVA